MGPRMEKKPSPEEIGQNAALVLSDPKRFDWIRMDLLQILQREQIEPGKENYDRLLEIAAKKLLVTKKVLKYEDREAPSGNAGIIFDQLIEAVKTSQLAKPEKTSQFSNHDKQPNLF